MSRRVGLNVFLSNYILPKKIKFFPWY